MTTTLIFENYPNPNINMLGGIKNNIPYFLQINNQYEIGDIETAKNTSNWVYPVAIKNPMLEKDVFVNSSKLNSKFFTRQINKEIIQLIAQGKGWICLDFTEEPISNEVLTHFVTYVDRVKKSQLKKDNLDKVLERTIILTTQMKSSRHSYIKNEQVFSLVCKRECQANVLDGTHIQILFGDIPKLKDRSQVEDNRVYSFFNYDYLADEIRFSSLALLQKIGLLDYGHISLLKQGIDFDEHYHDYCSTYNKRKLNISFNQNQKVHGLLDLKDTLDKSYINLVIEACYNKADLDTLYITEKTFRNYYLKKPFILIGQYESLSALQSIGYKSFHPYIDEEYDKVKDEALRLRLIFDELKRLCAFSQEKWVDFYKNINPILEHNYEVNTHIRPKSSYELFRKYING